MPVKPTLLIVTILNLDARLHIHRDTFRNIQNANFSFAYCAHAHTCTQMDAQSIGDESAQLTSTGVGCYRNFDHALVGGYMSDSQKDEVNITDSTSSQQHTPKEIEYPMTVAAATDDKTSQHVSKLQTTEQATPSESSPTVS